MDPADRPQPERVWHLQMIVDGRPSTAVAEWFQRHVLGVFEPLCLRSDPTNTFGYMRNWAHLKTARTILPYLRDPSPHHHLSVHGYDGGKLHLTLQDNEFDAFDINATKESWAEQVESEGWSEAFAAAAADIEVLPVLLSRSGVTYSDANNRRPHTAPAGRDDPNFRHISVSGLPISAFDEERRYVDEWPPPRIAAGTGVAQQEQELRHLSGEIAFLLRTYSHTMLAGEQPNLAARTDISGERRAKLEFAVALWADMSVWEAELHSDWRSIVLRDRVDRARLDAGRKKRCDEAFKERRGVLRDMRIAPQGAPVRPLPQTDGEWAVVRAEVAELSQWQDAAAPDFETQKRNAVATLQTRIDNWKPQQ
jgi:hypothetical protein